MSTAGARVARVVTGVSLAVVGTRLATLAVNAATIPVLRPTPGVPPARRVSVLVPARDEARTLPTTLPALLRQGAHEVLVLDDGSSDDTAATARALGARVLTGAPLPQGWAGKPWACAQLAEAATGDLLLFTDADVTWADGGVAALVAEHERTGATLTSAWPRQRLGSTQERLLTPLVDAAMLGHLPYPLMRAGLRGAVAANGQVMLTDPASYERVGGHGAVAGSVLDDVGLALAYQRAGLPVALARGDDAVSVRMYDSLGASVAGLAKSTPGLHGGSRAAMVGSALTYLVAFLGPWLVPPTAATHLARTLTLLDRAVVAATTGRTAPADLAEGLLGPLTPLLALPVYARALRRRVVWRGRSYPAR